MARTSPAKIAESKSLEKRKNQIVGSDPVPLPSKSPFASRLVIHKHEAEKAGDHYDIRLEIDNKAVSFATRKGLPDTGKMRMFFRQPDHVVDYMSWQGQIPTGEYGAGKVTVDYDAPVVVSTESDAIRMTVPDGDLKGTYVFMRGDGNDWKVVKKKELEREWSPKPKYQEVSTVPEGDYFTTEKLDGAHFLAKINPGGISFTSVRRSVKDDGLIAREDQVPHLRDLKLPSQYHGMVLRGELWHDKGFNTLSGILNSKPPRAVGEQQTKGLVRFAPFKIQKGPKGEEALPYEQQYNLLKAISSSLPHYFEPPKATDKPASEFFEDIGRQGGEGVILVDKKTGDSIKLKHWNEYTLKIVGFSPGKGRHADSGQGAFILVDKKDRQVGSVGSGLSDEIRQDAHKNPAKYVGKKVRVRSRKTAYNNLREPTFISFTGGDLDEV